MKTRILFFFAILISCAGFAQNADIHNLKESAYIGWVKNYCGPDSLSVPVDLKVDSEDNIYVTGYSYSDELDFDIVTIKYNTNGEEQWIAHYNGEIYSTDKPVEMVIDSQDNIYIAGYSYFDDNNFAYIILKYNGDGNLEWIAQNDGATHGIDKATALAIDKNDNIYITGTSHELDSSYSLSTIKYNSYGQRQWIAIDKNSSRILSTHVKIAVSNSGNVYISDESYYQIYPSHLIKYNQMGKKEWAKTSNSGIPYLAIDENDNIIIATNASPSFRITKYDLEGIEKWNTIFPAHPMGCYDLTDIAVFDQNNIYLSGGELIPASGLSNDGFLIKYDRFGNQKWINYNASTAREGINSIVVDQSNNIYAVGFGRNSLAYYAFWAAKYDSAGELKWNATYADAKFNVNKASDIAIDKNGNVIVLGYKEDDNKSIITILKYSPAPTCIFEDLNTRKFDYILKQNYPNPFNPMTTIEWHIAADTHVSLKIYDVCGREITTLVDRHQCAGSHSIKWDAANQPAGIYFARLEAREQVRTIKLLLAK